MTPEKKLLVKEKMERMAVLLAVGGYDDWSASINNLVNIFEHEPGHVRHTLLNMYGGMGSLNDLLIYVNGNLLVNENEELDHLRTELFDLIS